MKRKILVIDDEVDIAMLIKVILEMDTYTVETVSNSTIAFEVAQQFRPDAILLDLTMPLKNGYEVFKQFRSDKSFDKTPIAFLTAKSDDFDVMVGLHVVGADAYIKKPFGKQELVDKTHELFKRK